MATLTPSTSFLEDVVQHLHYFFFVSSTWFICSCFSLNRKCTRKSTGIEDTTRQHSHMYLWLNHTINDSFSSDSRVVSPREREREVYMQHNRLTDCTTRGARRTRIILILSAALSATYSSHSGLFSFPDEYTHCFLVKDMKLLIRYFLLQLTWHLVIKMHIFLSLFLTCSWLMLLFLPSLKVTLFKILDPWPNPLNNHLILG